METMTSDEKSNLHFPGEDVTPPATPGSPSKPALKRAKAKRYYGKSGYFSAKKALASFGSRALDARTVTARAISEWRLNVETDLGGVENLSMAERTLLDVASRTHLLLTGVDAWLLEQPKLVSNRNRQLIPALRDRSGLVSSLLSTLDRLGLKRRAKPVPALGEYVASLTLKAKPEANAATTLPDAAESKPDPFTQISTMSERNGVLGDETGDPA